MEFDFMFEFAVPDVFEVVVLVVDELFAVLVVVDIVFVVLAEFVTRLALALALFAVSPPQAIPRAVRPKRADSVMIFFISKSPVFLKDYVYLYFYTASYKRTGSKQTFLNIG
jgi:hypothetical protein